MASWELIQDRVVSGRGVLKVSTNGIRNRAFVLYTDVIRYPKAKHVNKSWNPEKSRYATLVFLRGGYVINSAPMEYNRQSYDGINDTSGQTLIAVKCMYQGILASFVNLAAAQGLSLTSYADLIKNYENLNLSWDEVRIVAFADTVIQARMYAISYDSCESAVDKTLKSALPVPPISAVPPGTSIPVSRPYDLATNDNGNTVPYPGDSIIQASVCTITYDYTDLYAPASSATGRVSSQFSALRPIVIGAVSYSNPGNLPNGSFKRSVVQITGSDGVVQNIQLVNNSFNGHTVSNLTSPCQVY